MVNVTINQLHDIVHDRFLTELTPSEVQDYIRVLEMRHAIMKDEIVTLREQKKSLEKALDKACEELDSFTEFVPRSNYPQITSDDEFNKIKQWKEWCMRDDG